MMLPDICYEFGGFVLNPRDRILLHFNQTVNLSGRDFDVLLHLVENAYSLVLTSDMIAAVWGPGTAIHSGNITNHIAKIRKALGCDPYNPTFIRTVYARNGYRFIAHVTPTLYEEATAKVESLQMFSRAEEFRVTSHVFVPVYLGPKLFSDIKGPVKATQWFIYKQFQVESGRMCILPSGIGVWHLKQANSFPTLMDMAAWRQELYDEIFKNKNGLGTYTENLIVRPSSGEQSLFEPVLGKPGYAYSAMILESPRWKSQEKVRKVLELLSCPKALEAKVDLKGERERLHILERRFLEQGLNSLDMREFGLSGRDIGFASWEGLSYYHLAENGDQSIQTLVEFQIAVQSLWWYSKCLSEIWLSNTTLAMERLKKFIPDLKKQFLVIKNIEAKESTSQRTMEEAVVHVNRLREIVEETIELYSE